MGRMIAGKRFLAYAAVTVAVFGACALEAQPAQEVRIATYNIQNLKASDRDVRFDALKELMAAMDADIYGLQEIADRAALEKIFDPAQWQLVVDDQSSDTQDLAVAVRAPLQVLGDLDADDEDFLFSDAPHFFYPNRRDVLHVRVSVPGVSLPLSVLVVHQKSRGGGGRDGTEPRRLGASIKLLEKLEHDFEEVPFVLLGDFNDNPDDASLNILETGDPSAGIETENQPGPFLINLTEPLARQGLVTLNLNNMEIDPETGDFDNVDFASRRRNIQGYGTNTHTGNILFDQILIPPHLLAQYVPGSITIFNGKENQGSSDHLPVYADFRFDGKITHPQPSGVLITALMPNPVGDDAGKETVTLTNLGDQAVDLDGWHMRDRLDHIFPLSGLLEAQQERVLTIPVDEKGRSVMTLTNSGDEVRLLDANRALVHQVEYSGMEAAPGHQIVRGPGG